MQAVEYVADIGYLRNLVTKCLKSVIILSVFTFMEQLREFLSTGHVQYFMLFFLVAWTRWGLIQSIASRYKPYTKSHKVSTSVVIPVVDESVELFREVLRRIVRQRPDQVIVVINGPRNKTIEQVCDEFKSVQRVWLRAPGKRGAIERGMKLVKHDLTLLIDSDTLWENSLLKEIKKPFRDPEVGGVTSSQRIYQPDRNLITKFADWLELIRDRGSMRAMSVYGTVGCLPGRTIAIRTSILNDSMHEFRNETFMGFHKEVSDDRSLTNLILQKGYKTVVQSTARVTTDAPTTLRKFARQQLRWSEGSQYNNLRMSAWMAKNAKLTFFIYWTDTIMPFILFGILSSSIITAITDSGTFDVVSVGRTVVIALAGATLSIGLRQVASFFEKPKNLLYIVPFVFILTFIMTAIRVIGFMKLADDLGWGTRKNAYKSKVRERRLIAQEVQ